VPRPRRLVGTVDGVEEERKTAPEGFRGLLDDLRVDAGRLEDDEQRRGISVPLDGGDDALVRRALVGRLAGEQRQDEDEHDDGDEGVNEEQWTYLRLTCIRQIV
jgi:hypothetical protein